MRQPVVPETPRSHCTPHPTVSSRPCQRHCHVSPWLISAATHVHVRGGGGHWCAVGGARVQPIAVFHQTGDRCAVMILGRQQKQLVRQRRQLIDVQLSRLPTHSSGAHMDQVRFFRLHSACILCIHTRTCSRSHGERERERPAHKHTSRQVHLPPPLGRRTAKSSE